LSKVSSISKRVLVGTLIIAILIGFAIGYIAAPAKIEEKIVEVPPKIKIAGIIQGAVEDGDWGTMSKLALDKIKEKYVGLVEIKMVEVSTFPEIEKAYRDLAEEGYDIVIGFGAQFADSALKVAPSYPETTFVFTCVNKSASNAVSILYLEEQLGFFHGLVAGKLTKSNIIGVVLGAEYACSNAYYNAFKYAVSLVNPNATVLVASAGTWIDPATGKSLAISMIDRGADVIGQYASVTGLGVYEACKERGVYTFGNYIDQSHFAPSSIVFSMYMTPYSIIDKIVAERLATGTVKGAAYNCGIREQGISPQYPFNLKVDKEIEMVFLEYWAKSLSGTFEIPRNETTPA
jgi:basic membrane protein A